MASTASITRVRQEPSLGRRLRRAAGLAAEAGESQRAAAAGGVFGRSLEPSPGFESFLRFLQPPFFVFLTSQCAAAREWKMSGRPDGNSWPPASRPRRHRGQVVGVRDAPAVLLLPLRVVGAPGGAPSPRGGRVHGELRPPARALLLEQVLLALRVLGLRDSVGMFEAGKARDADSKCPHCASCGSGTRETQHLQPLGRLLVRRPDGRSLRRPPLRREPAHVKRVPGSRW